MLVATILEHWLVNNYIYIYLVPFKIIIKDNLN